MAVIGGGPAGLMAAETLAQAGVGVSVYDRMPSVGRKFQLAGRGGLNITHSEPLDAFLDRYGTARAFLEPAIRAFPPDALRAWCAGLGEETFVGSSGRVFPKSFKATPLLRAWLARLNGLGVRFNVGHRWVGWDDTGALRFTAAAGEVLVRPSATVLALGGASWPRLGSDGGWVELLRQHGVVVNPLRPANCGFLHEWSPVFRERFAGMPLKRIAATFGGVTVRGEAMLTADGIEGGVIYALSRALREAIDAEGSATLMLDLLPDLDMAALAQRLGGHGQSLANALRRAGLSLGAAGLVRELAEPHPLPDRIKTLRLRLTGARPIERAISSAGGIALGELDMGFMLHQLPDVYPVGEMLDWEAPTGGYLLQAEFSTGRFLAGELTQRCGRLFRAPFR